MGDAAEVDEALALYEVAVELGYSPRRKPESLRSLSKLAVAADEAGEAEPPPATDEPMAVAATSAKTLHVDHTPASDTLALEAVLGRIMDRDGPHELMHAINRATLAVFRGTPRVVAPGGNGGSIDGWIF